MTSKSFHIFLTTLKLLNTNRFKEYFFMKNMKEIMEETKDIVDYPHDKSLFESEKNVDKIIKRLKRSGRAIPDGRVWKSIVAVAKQTKKVSRKLQKDTDNRKDYASFSCKKLNVYDLGEDKGYALRIGLEFTMKSDSEIEILQRNFDSWIEKFNLGTREFKREILKNTGNHTTRDSEYVFKIFYTFYVENKRILDKIMKSNIAKESGMSKKYGRKRIKPFNPSFFK